MIWGYPYFRKHPYMSLSSCFLEIIISPEAWMIWEKLKHDPICSSNLRLGAGFQYVLFSPLPGEMIQFDYIIFFKWVWNHQPDVATTLGVIRLGHHGLKITWGFTFWSTKASRESWVKAMLPASLQVDVQVLPPEELEGWWRHDRTTTLPETNSSHLKMDRWNTIVSFWGPAHFQLRTVSFRECSFLIDILCCSSPGLEDKDGHEGHRLKASIKSSNSMIFEANHIERPWRILQVNGLIHDMS